MYNSDMDKLVRIETPFLQKSNLYNTPPPSNTTKITQVIVICNPYKHDIKHIAAVIKHLNEREGISIEEIGELIRNVGLVFIRYNIIGYIVGNMEIREWEN